MDTAFWIQVVITVGSIASLGGGILARLNILEKKVDKHNSFMERLAVVETKLSGLEKGE